MDRCDERPPAVRLRGLRVVFTARIAVDAVDLDIAWGAITTIAGPNGAGKSTLLEVIAGTRPPSTGSRRASGTIAFVPQRTAISHRLPVTLRDVVTVGAWGDLPPWRRVGAERRAAVDDAMERLHITELAAEPFAGLSGGQRQRALLAQGLARRPDVLLLDEPTTGLDAGSSARIRTALREEAGRGTAVVAVSHDTAVLEMADHLVVLSEGRIVSPTPADGSRG